MDPVTLLVLALPLVAFWVFLIRPAQRRQRELAAVRASLEPGQQVVTSSGILATVREVADDVVHLEVADGVVLRFVRGAVSGVVPEQAAGGDAPEA